MSFQQGLSGLNVAAKTLDVIGNNVANAGVVGFKASGAQFGDVFANSLSGGGATQIGIGAQLSAVEQQFSQGNISSTSNPLDIAINGRGFFRMDDNGSITFSRNGQFHSDSAGYIVNNNNARLTGYAANAAGNIVGTAPSDLQVSTADIAPKTTSALSAGFNLDSRSVIPSTVIQGSLTGTAGAMVFPLTITVGVNDTLTVDLNGTPGTATIAPGAYASAAALTTAMQTAINAVPGFVGAGYSATVSAVANVLTITSDMHGNGSSVNVTGGTAQASLQLGTFSTVAGADNFNANNPATFTSSTSGSVYDSLGISHVFTLYFLKTGGNAWNTYATVDGAATAGGTPIGVTLGGGASQALTFDTNGALTLPVAPFTVSMDLNAVAAALGTTNGATSPATFTLDVTKATQFGGGFSVNALTQDGYGSGRLAGFSVGGDGTMVGHYSNGQTRTMGQVVLADFANPQGLKPMGSNQWEDTTDSGLPLVGVPGGGSLGSLQASAVEESNVDLTAELVNMITAQRVYQANAQSIKTQDAVLQTLVNLR
jgi:flagellar hook protein FlgE